MNAVLLLVLGLLLVTSSSSAQAPVPVSILDAGSPALTRKVRAEAQYAGFESVPLARQSGSVASGAAAARATAVVRIDSEDRVELQVADLGGTLHAQVLLRSPGEGDSFALRVIEQLRASCVDLGWLLPVPGRESSAAGPAAVLPAAAPAAAVRPAAMRPAAMSSANPRLAAVEVARRSAAPRAGTDTLWIDSGIAASWASGGLGVSPHVLLGARADFGSTWGTSLTALLPLASNDLAAREGESESSWQLFAAALAYAPALPAPWLGSAGLGAGLSVVHVRGEGALDFEGRSDRLLAGAYFAELCAGRRLANWLRLRATLLTGLNAPRPVLRFDGREVASLGPWFWTLGISLDVGLALTGPEAP